jgi:hypothetical protein
MVGPASVSVDYLTSFTHEYTCVFSVVIGDIETTYVTYLDKNEAYLPKAELAKYLLDNQNRATCIKCTITAAQSKEV